MEKNLCIIVAALIFGSLGCTSAPQLIDSFEGVLDKQTVDYGASEGSRLEVSASGEIKSCGEQSLKIDYELAPSGYMWCARGFNLDVKGAAQWLLAPVDIAWKKYNTLVVSMYGKGDGGVIALDTKDSGGEIWRFILEDDTQGWKEYICPFSQFFPRKDWQPETALVNDVLDFPIMSFQFEPRYPAKGTYYFDCVKLAKIKETKK